MIGPAVQCISFIKCLHGRIQGAGRGRDHGRRRVGDSGAWVGEYGRELGESGAGVRVGIQSSPLNSTGSLHGKTD